MNRDTNQPASSKAGSLVYDSLLIIAIWIILPLLLVALINDGAPLGGPLFQLGLYFEACLFLLLLAVTRSDSWDAGLENQIDKPKLSNIELARVFCKTFFSLVSISMLGLGFYDRF